MGFVPLVTFFVGERRAVHLLYLDESGIHGGPYFVLAGLAVHETQTLSLSAAVDSLQKTHLTSHAQAEPLRATAIRAGADPPWDKIERERRYALLDAAYEVIRNSQAILFGVSIERK